MYQRILVPIDGSPTSLKGLGEAIRVARLAGGALRLIHVVDELKYVTGFETGAAYNEDLVPLMEDAGRQVLEQGREIAEHDGIEAQTVLFTILAGRVSDLVVEQAKAWNADLIVIGTHGGRGVGRVLMGSDAEHILRSAPVPVLLVRAVGIETEAQAEGKAGRSAPAGAVAARCEITVAR